MSELNRLCFEVLRLLSENIEPKIAYEPEAESWRCPDATQIGLAAVVRFAETLREGGHRVTIDGDEIYEKLAELANAIAFADFGETSAAQTYLYRRVSKICEMLRPTVGRRVRLSKILEQAPSTSADVFDADDDSNGNASSPEEEARPPDAIYARISELFHASVTGASTPQEIAAKVDAIVDSLQCRSRVRSKSALLARLRDANDAVNTLSGGPSSNVTYARFLKFQVDEVHAMLVNDVFDDREVSLYAQLRTLLLEVGHCLRKFARDTVATIVGEIKRTLEAVNKTLSDGVAYLHQNSGLIWECVYMSVLTLVNFVVFGFAIVA